MPETQDPGPSAPPPLEGWLVALRGLIGRCPSCGRGRLLRRYLKPVERCEQCGEAFGHIRADDGPAWLTIVVVGHIMGPLLLYAVPGSRLSDAVAMLVWPLVALLLALLVLPRAKGLFIGLIWRSGSIGSERT
jgi:uncharacterized protein (DUF983 family)